MFLSIDYGKKRIGLAVGAMIPRGLPVLSNSDGALEKIGQIIKREDISAVVVGLPFRSQGEEGTISAEIRQFAQKLNQISAKPVYFEPEELTSAEAEQQIKEKNLKYAVDELAAVLILEQFLDHIAKVGIENIKPDIG